MFWVISVLFELRNTLPKSGTFLLGHIYAGFRRFGVAVKTSVQYDKSLSLITRGNTFKHTLNCN